MGLPLLYLPMPSSSGFRSHARILAASSVFRFTSPDRVADGSGFSHHDKAGCDFTGFLSFWSELFVRHGKRTRGQTYSETNVLAD
jgi:hypothetical protein